MSRRIILVACILAAFLTPAAGAGTAPTIDDIGWLAGCWTGGGEGHEYAEQWMKPAGGTMLGMSRTVAGGKTVAHEFIQIRTEDDGVYYVAKPSGQDEAAFKLVSGDAKELVFENQAHDFPQRIVYRLESEGRLMAMVEGTIDGKLRQEKFPMTRVSCD